MLMATINHMTEKGLPFKLKGYSVSYYRLLSSGPHPAGHFLWKRSINDTLDCSEQLSMNLSMNLKINKKHTILE